MKSTFSSRFVAPVLALITALFVLALVVFQYANHRAEPSAMKPLETQDLAEQTPSTAKKTKRLGHRQLEHPPLAIQTNSPENPVFRIISRLPEPIVAQPLPDGDSLIPSATLDVTSSSVIDPNSIQTLQKLAQGDDISFPHSEGGWIPAKVSYRTQNNATGEVILAGKLGNREGHSFSLTFNNGEVDGVMLLPDENRAYLIQKARDGRLFLQDKPIQAVVCHGMPVGPNEDATPARSTRSPEQNIIVPILDSRPTATAVLYLDFDGEVVTDPRWASGQTIIALPAVMGGNPISVNQITDVWEIVSEDFRPFDISVTTDVERYNNAPIGQRMRCIQTPTKTAAPTAGGVAYIDSFSLAGNGTFSANIPCWSFNSNDARTMAMTISHELGHTVGLRHDGRIAVQGGEPAEEYYSGHGSGVTSWGPLMGAPFGRRVTQWSKGEYFRANRFEDDLALIARPANSFGFRTDAIGNTPGTSKLVDGNLFGDIDESGLIEETGDVDYFRFVTQGGQLDVTCAPNSFEPNLKTKIELRDSNNIVVTDSSPVALMTSSISRTIPAGVFYIVVSGTGVGEPTANPASGFTEYGSLGGYQLTGTFPSLPVVPFISVQPQSRSVDEGAAVTLRVTAFSNSPLKYQWFKIVNGVEQAIPKATSGSYKISAANASHIAEYYVRLTNATGITISDTVSLAVFRRVRITSQPADAVLAAGESTVLAPGYLGDGDLTFRWFKNNKLIVGEDSDTLELNDVIWSDAGSYKLEVRNRLNKATTRTAIIRVNSPPVLLAMPNLLAIRTNSSARLTPQVAGSAPLTFQWYKDGVLIPGATRSNLPLRGLPTSPGLYKVVVTNGFGELTSDETEVVVDDRLIITQHPVAGGPFTSGQNTTLTVETSGSDPKTYQWQLNGKDIVGATAQNLTIDPIDWFNNGRYRVIVSNRVSKATSRQTVMKVASPPVITMEPVTTKGARNGRVTFAVRAVGTSKLTYQWRKEGEPIPRATGTKFTMTRIDTANEGLYDVVVTNSLGSVTSTPAALIVEDPPTITLHPQPAFVAVGDSITATVSAAGSPELRYQWQRNKRNIIGATSSSLSLPDATIADSGSFRVIVTNDVGKVTSKTALLRVMIRPSIVTHPADVTIYDGETATFRVTATGSKPLKYRWFFGGVPISTSATLKRTNVRPEQAGEYSVEVSNAVDSVLSETATLTIIPVPTPTISLLVPTTAKTGQKIALLGTNLRWTRSLTVNNRSVGFVVTAGDEVIGTLPSNATSGKVKVTNRGGSFTTPSNLTVSSNANNDMFRNSMVLTGAKPKSSAVTLLFTNEASEPIHANLPTSGSAWWRWIAPTSQSYTVSTFGSSFDTVLAVYAGEDIATLSRVTFNNNVSAVERHSQVTFTAFQGAAYRIAVAGLLTETGLASLNIAPASASAPVSIQEVAAETPMADLLAENELAESSETILGGIDSTSDAPIRIWRPAMPESLTGATLVTTAFTAALELPETESSEDTFAWTLYNRSEQPLLGLSINAADGSISMVNSEGETWVCDTRMLSGSSFKFEIVTNAEERTWSLRIDGVTIHSGHSLGSETLDAELFDMAATWERAQSAPATLTLQGLEVWTN